MRGATKHVYNVLFGNEHQPVDLGHVFLRLDLTCALSHGGTPTTSAAAYKAAPLSETLPAREGKPLNS